MGLGIASGVVPKPGSVRLLGPFSGLWTKASFFHPELTGAFVCCCCCCCYSWRILLTWRFPAARLERSRRKHSSSSSSSGGGGSRCSSTGRLPVSISSSRETGVQHSYKRTRTETCPETRVDALLKPSNTQTQPSPYRAPVLTEMNPLFGAQTSVQPLTWHDVTWHDMICSSRKGRRIYGRFLAYGARNMRRKVNSDTAGADADAAGAPL